MKQKNTKQETKKATQEKMNLFIKYLNKKNEHANFLQSTSKSVEIFKSKNNAFRVYSSILIDDLKFDCESKAKDEKRKYRYVETNTKQLHRAINSLNIKLTLKQLEELNALQ